ncbi:MAG: hypothetical protein IPK53_01320 [bacterium]|nr:hypothetical protein [bacterium]MBK8127605.1 hypothetical protein [bacterium]
MPEGWVMFLKIAGLLILWVVTDKIGDFLLGFWSTDSGSIPGMIVRVFFYLGIVSLIWWLVP